MHEPGDVGNHEVGDDDDGDDDGDVEPRVIAETSMVDPSEPDVLPTSFPVYPRSSNSAIWTAFVAAPLRSWSPTTQKFSARG